MKYLLLGVMSLSVLVACQKPESGSGPVLDSKALAERFMQPAGGKPVAALVFNERGDAVVVTADGKLGNACRLPSMDGQAETKDAASASVQLSECHGTKDTTIYGVTQITVVRHKGSTCELYTVSPPNLTWQVCW